MIRQRNMSGGSWDSCTEHYADGSDCEGIKIGETERCFFHSNEGTRAIYLARFRDSRRLDLRGTYLTSDLTAQVATASQDASSNTQEHIVLNMTKSTLEGSVTLQNLTLSPESNFSYTKFLGQAQFYRCRISATFSHTCFTGGTRFDNAIFGGFYSFDHAHFGNATWFTATTWMGPINMLVDSTFDEYADFMQANFNGTTFLQRNTFKGETRFLGSRFNDPVSFANTEFQGTVDFSGSHFGPEARFEKVRFTEEARFSGSKWSERSIFSPIIGEEIFLDSAELGRDQLLGIAARRLNLCRVSLPATPTTLSTTADIDLEEASLSAPLLIQGPTPSLREFLTSAKPSEPDSFTTSIQPRILSLRSSSVEALVLNNADLSSCRFVDTHNLDRLKIEGNCKFSRPPKQAIHRYWIPWFYWSRRNVIVEESAWRSQARYRKLGWTAQTDSHVLYPYQSIVTPRQISSLYRSLRKGLEDNKNEPGAADFYYGEMEMRRLGASRLSVERWLLNLYWLLGGYSLRAWRAFAGLAFILLACAGALELFGFVSHRLDYWSVLVFGLRSGSWSPKLTRGPYARRVNIANRIEASLPRPTRLVW